MGLFRPHHAGAAATEFASVARAPVQWVPGGHSWMLARPQGQSDILLHLASGHAFMSAVEDRWRQFTHATTRCAPSTRTVRCHAEQAVVPR